MTTDGRTRDDGAAAPGSGPSGVIRPLRAASRRAVRSTLYIVIPVIVVALVRAGPDPWLVPLLAGLSLLSLAVVMLFSRNARIEFGDGRVRVVNLVGASREFTAAEAGTVVSVTTLITGGMAASAPQLLVNRPDGSRLLRLRGQRWDSSRFSLLADQLSARGVMAADIPETLSGPQLRARYPHAVGWAEGHPIGSALLVGFVVLAVILAAGIVVALVLQEGVSN